MKKTLRYTLITLWLVFFSVAFAKIWLNSPALWVINLPDSAWTFLIELHGATCCEEVAKVEVHVALVFGFILASIILTLFFFIKSRIKRRTSLQAELPSSEHQATETPLNKQL